MYQQFKRMDIDHSLIGLEQRKKSELYYCTPENAEIIGWAGVDGIHYCTIPRFGEMVFAVSPMNFGDCVHPIAYSFRDLLCLLLSCGDMAVLEQCHAWDRKQYNAFLKECPITEEQQAVLDKLKTELKLKPIKDVFKYVKNLQAEFDYSAIPYPDEYYDSDLNPNSPLNNAEWSVSFRGGFWGNEGTPGQEVKLCKSFTWGDEKWNALSAYICEEGLVVDFGVEISLEKLNAFLDKWDLRGGEFERYTKLEQEMIQNEQPLKIGFRSELVCNGRMLRSDSGCSISWIPSSCHLDENVHDIDSRRIMSHYGLDTDKAWALWRCTYRWTGQKEQELHSMELSLKRDPKRYAGMPFTCPEKGASVEVENPVTGEKYWLTVQEISHEEIDPSVFRNPSMEYPTHCMEMTYSVEPDIDNQYFTLQDMREGDKPRSATPDSPIAMIAVIGGTNVAKVGDKFAVSSMHFDTEFDVEWVPMFSVKEMEDIRIGIGETK